MDAKERRKQRNRAYYIAHPEKFRVVARPCQTVRAIYILRNTSDSCIYIGETANLACRWRQHKRTTCKSHPAEGWTCDVFLRLPVLPPNGICTAVHRLVEHLVITHHIRAGHTLLNQNGTIFFSQWEWIERDLLPYLPQFDEESRVKVVELIRDVYNRDVPPPGGSPPGGVKMT
jgi:hypothetical protein